MKNLVKIRTVECQDRIPFGESSLNDHASETASPSPGYKFILLNRLDETWKVVFFMSVELFVRADNLVNINRTKMLVLRISLNFADSIVHIPRCRNELLCMHAYEAGSQTLSN